MEERTQEQYVYEDVEIRVDENVRSFRSKYGKFRLPQFHFVRRTKLADRIPIRYGLGRNIRFVYSGTQVYVSYVLVERGAVRSSFCQIFKSVAGIWTLRVLRKGYGVARYHMASDGTF